jgi:hypothetical protein
MVCIIERYVESDDEELDPHAIVSKSNGADLEQLLAEAEAPFAQAYYRHRSLLDSISTDLPTTQPTISEQVATPCPLHRPLAAPPCLQQQRASQLLWRT